MNDVLIRSACAGDIPAIVLLWRELMDFHGRLNPVFTRAFDGEEQYREQLFGWVFSDKSCVLVADRSGLIAGYCIAVTAQYPPIFERADYGVIYDLAVAELCRHQGIGEKLYREAQAWLATMGIHRIEVRVAAENPVSTKFWQKMGFTPHMMTVAKSI